MEKPAKVVRAEKPFFATNFVGKHKQLLFLSFLLLVVSLVGLLLTFNNFSSNSEPKKETESLSYLEPNGSQLSVWGTITKIEEDKTAVGPAGPGVSQSGEGGDEGIVYLKSDSGKTFQIQVSTSTRVGEFSKEGEGALLEWKKALKVNQKIYLETKVDLRNITKLKSDQVNSIAFQTKENE